MKIDNRTEYDTRLIRTMLCLVHKHDTQGRLRTWKRLSVEIRYPRKGQGREGYAYYSGYNARLYVNSTGFDVERFLAVWRHELWHLHGIKHSDYPPDLRWARTGGDWLHARMVELQGRLDAHPDAEYIEKHDAWLVRPQKKVEAPKPTKEQEQAKKVERLLARRKAWLTKAKRATNALAKIDKSLAYYRREGLDVPELEPAPRKAASAPRRKRRKKS
jgi:hypothetical protein